MLPELGYFALIIAMLFSMSQWGAPLCIARGNLFSVISVFGQIIFLGIALLTLMICFFMNDMSVVYVQEHSHALLPFFYRIGATWGGHEGSLLLWCFILSAWMGGFITFSFKKLDASFLKKVLTLLGLINTGFIIFLIFTSNPFLRQFPDTPIIGDDLTPILQDPGLIIHPPILYLGYVGFALGFAFSIAALLSGKLDKNWVRILRPWIILPWGFLSIGIVMGSWWAYRELGWGGWWFWDPVENASLLPWLAATAFLHCLIVSEKRDVFKGWTILLGIITFSLSLLGTFLVRSGVLISVHAFANDPTRGIFLLCYLALIIGGALLLYSVRIKNFFKVPTFHFFSREMVLLVNSVFFLTAVLTIIIGTLYPILLETLSGQKISVGEPYFNLVFLPIMLPLLLLMGFAPHMNWGMQSIRALWLKLYKSFFLSLVIGFSIPCFFGDYHVMAGIGSFIASWIFLSTCQAIFLLWENKKIMYKHYSMAIAHIGIAVLVLGITINKTYSEETQVKLKAGETVIISNYQFKFEKEEIKKIANYQSMETIFSVTKNNRLIGRVIPEQRIYLSHEQMMNKPAILVNIWRDLYVVLGTALPDNNWSVRIYYKPLVRWIWAGGFLLLIGGLLALFRNGGRDETS